MCRHVLHPVFYSKLCIRSCILFIWKWWLKWYLFVQKKELNVPTYICVRLNKMSHLTWGNYKCISWIIINSSSGFVTLSFFPSLHVQLSHSMMFSTSFFLFISFLNTKKTRLGMLLNGISAFLPFFRFCVYLFLFLYLKSHSSRCRL